MPFTIVDFPAPLSPTSAVTLPAQASIPASLSTCTAPKCLFMPRKLSSGAPAPDSVVLAVMTTPRPCSEADEANWLEARCGGRETRPPQRVYPFRSDLDYPIRRSG